MKERINQDFTAAYKAGNTHLKTTLGGVKLAITNWETSKQNTGKTITDADIINILGIEAKKRKDAIVLYTQEGSDKGLANAFKESYELELINNYLPKQMSEDEIKNIVITYLGDHILPTNDLKALRGLMGGLMKEFKSNYTGAYDAQKLKLIIEDILELTV